MERTKTWGLAFVVGGAYAVVGQIIFMLLAGAFGAEFPYLGQLTLLGLGVVALIMYIPGLHQKIAAKSGFGSILPFNGFACGVADAYQGGVEEGYESVGKGVLSAVKLVLFVVGIGALIDAIVGVIAFYVV